MKKRMDKKGISIMIGYVLLITAAIAMSFIVYSWMKTYVPQEELKCPDDVSMTIKEVKCNSANYQMTVTIKNNGLFNIDGYVIKGDTYTKDGLVGVGKKDLYEQGYFYFSEPCKPQKDCMSIPFGGSVTDPLLTIKEIEITPIRAQFNAKIGKNETTICGNAVTKKTAPDPCIIRLKN